MGKNQIPYEQNPPLWGHNPYQQGWVPPPGPAYWPQIPFDTQLLFLATLELSDVSWLTNDLIIYSPLFIQVVFQSLKGKRRRIHKPM